MSPFKKTLKDLHRAQEQARRVRRATDEELGLHDGFQQFDDVRNRLVALIETRMEDFAAEVVGFTVHHGFFAGCYAVTLSAHLPAQPAAARRYSRITYLLSPQRPDQVLEVDAKLTVRSRDLVTHHARGLVTDPTDQEALERFVEDQMLRFAAAWFRAATPVTVPS